MLDLYVKPNDSLCVIESGVGKQVYSKSAIWYEKAQHSVSDCSIYLHPDQLPLYNFTYILY